MEPIKYMINNRSYYLQYNEDLMIDSNKINVFGYVSFIENDLELNSINNQIKIINNHITSNPIYNLYRIYVDINEEIDNDTDFAFKSMHNFILNINLDKLYKKISIVTTDISRLLNINHYDILCFVKWIDKRNLYFECILNNFDINNFDGLTLFQTSFLILKNEKLITKEKLRFLRR